MSKIEKKINNSGIKNMDEFWIDCLPSESLSNNNDNQFSIIIFKHSL